MCHSLNRKIRLASPRHYSLDTISWVVSAPGHSHYKRYRQARRSYCTWGNAASLELAAYKPVWMVCKLAWAVYTAAACIVAEAQTSTAETEASGLQEVVQDVLPVSVASPDYQ